jgi:DNA polymerase III delta prime subunit
MNCPFVYKYMPSTLNEFDMEFNMKQLLYELIQSNIINIIITGDNCSGKTILSNIIVHEYYMNEPKSNINDNILCINSLREQGVHYYRSDVKCFCQTASTIVGKKKIIILDDLDLINNQSQQIFLNYMDKYSHNVHFITTCSNPQKIIDNIHSRLINIKLSPITSEYLSSLLYKVIEQEKIQIQDDAISNILSISKKSSRVLLNYLEKFKLIKLPITNEIVYNLSTDIKHELFDTFTQYILKKDKINAIKTITNIQKEGYSVIDILEFYFLYLKMAQYEDDIKYRFIQVLCKYITIFNTIHEDNIELLFFVNDLEKIIN